MNSITEPRFHRLLQRWITMLRRWRNGTAKKASSTSTDGIEKTIAKLFGFTLNIKYKYTGMNPQVSVQNW
jgi:hypothetical protein